MTLRENLLNLIRDEDYRGMTKEDLANYYDLGRGDFEIFFKCLYDMEREGLIYLSRKGKYLPQDNPFIDGALEGSGSGFAFFIPDNKDLDDIFIPGPYMHGALHKDRVRVKMNKEAYGDQRAEGEVVKILSPVDAEIVGTLVKEGDYFFVEPNGHRYGKDIFIPKKYLAGAKHNDKVVVKLLKRGKKNRNPEGRIIEVLGSRFRDGVEISAIAREFDLPNEWPNEVMDQVKGIPDEVSAEDIEGRTDFTDLFTVTIDGENAKDFDDAISIEKEGDLYRLYVHIADVAHYVKSKSPIDKEAMNRGNSVYLLDRVIPMIPEALSNVICSLQPDCIRLTQTVEMLIDQSGTVKDYSFHESYIRSKHRLIYDMVSDFLEKEIPMGDEEVEEKLLIMDELREVLHQKRLRRGALDFNIPESDFALDDRGRIIGIFPRDHRTGDALIEEFMIVCNETVAEHFGHMEYPFIYRTHEDPAAEKVAAFKESIRLLGYHIKGKDVHSKDFQILLKEVHGKPEERLISMLLLRSMKKARYRPDRDKHFGLASTFYSHFTAPIRRYGDLVIHRIFKDAVHNSLKMDDLGGLYAYLDATADHISDTERRAEDAERAVEAHLKVEYMRELVGRSFKGIVSSLTSFGIYVELENTVEGLAAFRNQRDDYYSYDKTTHRVFAERSGREIKIGQSVIVKVLGVDAMRNEIDFEIVEW